MEKKLVLAHKSLNIRRIIEFIRNEDKIFWLYMGRDYSDMLVWRERLSGVAQQVEFGRELQSKAKDLRRPFIDFMAETGCRNNKFVYWTSIVFEKNTVLSPMFQNCCNLEVLKDYLDHNIEFKTLIVISGSWSFLETIKINLESPLLEIISLNNNASKFTSILKDYFTIMKNSLFFIAKCFLEYASLKLFCKKYNSLNSSDSAKGKMNKWIILRSWAHNNLFDKEGVFNDVYLPILGKWLKANGYEIKIMPLLLMPKLGIRSILKSYKNIMLLLSEKKNNFIVPWKYLKIRDIFIAYKMCFGQLWLRFDKQYFYNWNLHILLNEERRKFALNQRGLGCALHYLLIKRLAENNIKIERAIYTFENMLTEKLFLIGLKKYYPDAKSVGFQHSVLYPLKLDMYISEKEITKIPLPSKIVCSGDFFRNIMIKEKYPAEKLEIGPALRFAHIYNKKENIKIENKSVLIACPGYRNELVELLYKVLTALRDEDVSLWIKPKPDTPMIDVIDEIIKKTNINPAKIKKVSGSLSELLNKANIMITIASGAIIDGIASGIPVLRIKREMDLDLDPLDWLNFDPKRDFIAYTVSDIKRETIRALTLSEAEKEWLKEYGQKITEEMFSPVSEETLRVFLN